jgi:radical SAM protein with 4Fe4S-binding SPASM domain
MVPKIGTEQMTTETFERMLKITEKVLERGDYEQAVFRLSGGEPLLAFENYRDLVTEYTKKSQGKITFGVLTNLTLLTDEIIGWLLENKIGIQVSLDDLENSKPLKDGKSTSEVTMKNIERIKKAGVAFSINTVLDLDRTQNLNKMVNYVSRLGVVWGLNGSYTLDDDSRIEEMIGVFKEAVLILYGNSFDVYRRFRFYNMVLENPQAVCTAGVNVFALGTNLEMWPCQSMISEKSIGYFDENFKQLLETSEENKYYRERTMLQECTDCSILQWCRGGCRPQHSNKKCMETVCRIKRDVVQFIWQKIPKMNLRQRQETSQQIVDQKLTEAIEGESQRIQTPDLPKAG